MTPPVRRSSPDVAKTTLATPSAPTRRVFLETAGMGIGLAALSGATSQAQAQTRPMTSRGRSAADRVRVGIMGMGGRGNDLARVFGRQSNVEIAAVCDVDRERLGRAADEIVKWSGQATPPKAVNDFRAILDDPAIDVFVVAACNHWHAPAAILGVQAGKPVYVEKPCSHNPREGELMVEASRKTGKPIQMGNQRRSYPALQEAMNRLRAGELGRLSHAQCFYFNNRPSIGKAKELDPPAGLDFDLWQGPAPRTGYRPNILHYNWHWFWHWGNGELGNNGVHMIDVCRWALGVGNPVRVVSAGGRYRFDDDQETPDTQQTVFEYADGKSICYSGLSCDRSPVADHPDVIVYGENGSLAIRRNGYSIHDPKGKEIERNAVPSPDDLHIANFLDAVRENKPLNSPIAEGHLSTLACHLGNIAQRLGRALRCDPATGTILDDAEAMTYWSREYAPGWEPRV
ncbi:oxidoreductase domain protein [Isosphaera pallida ATCC 43644]|uniref:Oxidoreductase domain protein n=1 Tax=Isosphaera pallida (strain ATCC 43644 / DSM 9630 / IS1B) TaxID=575540 RepID=E8R614_ISOPI|nr:Gfo/Idh/MocA family oxidoreductase [Isosphaera pallida]ADV63916.1 oxidoreductase domain protein [Isosphaera pallida ATCC 43644]